MIFDIVNFVRNNRKSQITNHKSQITNPRSILVFIGNIMISKGFLFPA
ncbi:Uncharacterized protein dnm_067750 [Desulfonema magnum]|uniref:Uncharacterized protein n=1 Tax=Desulfonema magnum TaxID=45655 RepID=A0A975BT30_9BACT|nr:Uncharacterized protein dnm_067750 [Desulfonema magnum]